MSPLPEKFTRTLDEAAARLLARAEDARALGVDAVRPRLAKAVEKYLFADGASPEHAEIIEFIDEVRADELCLILACERGDARAWEDLVERFDATVKSAARRVSSNSEEAEDLSSSIWAELYGLRTDADGTRKSKLAYYSGRGSLGGWLRAVVSQLAIDQFRRDARFVQIEEEREFESIASDAASRDGHGAAAHLDDPENLYIETRTAADLSAALSAAVASLDAEDRLIMKLYYFDDLKLKDIAAAFGFHEATASRRLTRIQAEIRRAVETDLMNAHGWTAAEVRQYLSDAAAGLGIGLEQLFAAFLLVAVVQDIWF